MDLRTNVTVSEKPRRDRGDSAADLAEILEDDAEQHGVSGGNIAAAYPRLRDRSR